MTPLAWAFTLPWLGAAGVAVTGRRPNLREGVTLFVSLLTVLFSWSLLPEVLEGARPALSFGEMMPGLSLAFEVEPLGMLFACIASGLWLVTSVYSIGYMRAHHEQHQTRFYACFAIAIGAALGIAFAKNLLTLFLFYEVLTFSTYPLVTHHGGEEDKRAGRVYLGILVFTSVVFLLLAILITWHLTGTLTFRPGGILAGRVSPELLPILLALFAFGAGKAALMPLHRWLPNAMVAPAPVSALLHAVAVVKAGVFTILKVVVYVFGIDLLAATHASVWLMYVAGATLIIASIIAIRQDNLKARLAYSTISHLAYIVLGAALASNVSALGAGLHIVMHAVAKITLFFCAGAIMVAAHKTKVSELNGLGRRMPLTMFAFLLASLSLIGLPPLGGMWSKWYLALGAAESGNDLFLWVYMLSSLLSIGYLMPVVARAFFFPPDEADAHHEPDDSASQKQEKTGFWAQVHEAPALCLVPLCLTALMSVVLFFAAQPVAGLIAPAFDVSEGRMAHLGVQAPTEDLGATR